MRVICKAVTFWLAVVFCFLGVASAQQPKVMPFGYPAGRLESMRLLSPEVGWTATRSHLFWTTTAGREWKDITPRAATPEQRIIAVFFRDPIAGWVLFAGSSDDQARFDLASTSDSGGHWVLSRVKTSGLTPAEAHLTGNGYMYFLDSTHGWINLGVASGSAFHPGAALATQDGGKTWNWVTMGSGSAGPILFTTLKDGWILSPDHTELDVTHDGSKSWQEVKLEAPPIAHAGGGEAASYFLPVFEGAKDGFLMAGFEGSDRMTLFVTTDGGLTWKGDRVLPRTDESSITILDSKWIAAHLPLHGTSLEISTIPLRVAGAPGTVRADVGSILGTHALGGDADHLDFADDSNGWVLAGELLGTSNGGSSWIDITPAGARPAGAERPATLAQPSGTADTRPKSPTFEAKAAAPSPSPGVQTGLGFDIGLVLCTAYPTCSTQSSINNMQSWANSSPYLVTSLYLPSQNHTADHYLNPSWVSAIEQQGWGLIPIWVGVQSPCTCRPNTGTWPNCTLFTYLIPNTVAAANAQGISDAKAAENAALILGAGAAIIYKDIENYNPASALSNGVSCGSVVNAYLDGWDNQLHSDFYTAGAYGNPTPPANWSANVSPLPDDVWIAQANNQVTIWNQGTKYGMTDSMWPSFQRIHQYTGTHSESWGTAAFGIDGDIVNAEVVSNSRATGYSYAPVNIDCTNLGALQTFPLAINDMNNGAFINGPGQTGTIVGSYADSSDNIHGFESTAGTCTSIDLGPVTSSSVTELTGINNLGQIVGFYQNSTSNYGYLLNPGKTPVKIAYQGGFWCLTGINDAGQIVGIYPGLGGNTPQGLLYYGSTFYQAGPAGGTAGTGPIDGLTNCSLDAPGYGMAINGDATVAGSYYEVLNGAVSNFQESLVPPRWGGAITSPDPGGSFATFVEGVDSNNELAGVYPVGESSPACSNGVNQCGFMWPAGGSLSILQTLDPAVGGAWAAGINDFGQVVGQYLDSAGYNSGALWTHQ